MKIQTADREYTIIFEKPLEEILIHEGIWRQYFIDGIM